MVHKKYIKKNGKTFGPYLYENYREEGITKTRYLGKEEKEKMRGNSSYLGLILIFLFLSLAIITNWNLTGNVSLDIKETYTFEEKITGNLNLFLEPGEFLPAATIVKINEKDFLLSNLISEETTQGNFYLEDAEINGSGLGYGNLDYPSVKFVLSLTEKESSTEKPVEEKNETVAEKPVNETFPDSSENETEEITEEEPIEEENKTIEEEPKEKSKESLIKEKDEIIIEEPAEETTEEEPEPISETDTEEESLILITGDAIKKTFGLTGSVISETEIIGEVSYNQNYTYETKPNQKLKVLSSEQKIKLKTEKNQTIVTTDYKGEQKQLTINLTKLNLSVEQERLTISLSYDKQEIVSTSKSFSVEEIIPEENITISPILNETNLTETNQTITIINESGITINTTQFTVILNRPVKWKKNIKLDKEGIVKIDIPKEAYNISVFKIELNETSDTFEITENETINQTIENITSEETLKNETSKTIESPNKTKQESTKRTKVKESKITITGKTISGQISNEIEVSKEDASFFKKFVSFLTGRIIAVIETAEVKEISIDENATEYDIEYETPGPTATETNTPNGKNITITSDVHYENILAYTQLPREVKASQIKLYQTTNNSKLLTPTTNYDLNNNSLIDYVEWIVPHLSNQTYSLIIEITKAEHLNENRTSISDIYEEVKALDGNWSEEIPNSHYVRVTFEQELDSSRDITIYTRSGCISNDGFIVINGTEIPCDIYQKKKRIDEIREELE